MKMPLRLSLPGLVLFCCLCCIPPVISNDTPTNDQALPNGYYSFSRAPPNLKPPKVRKPPYLPISADCPGLQDSSGFISKNNLCGDINRGFIPRNPMGQYLSGQPYPFELIKNKTLQFLSKTLPYLKEEIESIPKVARFVKPSEFFENHSRRYARQVSNFSEGSQLANSTSVKNTPKPLSEGIPEVKEVNVTKLSRQQLCEGNVLCQALESLKEDGFLSKSFLSNVFSAVGNVANTNSIVSLLDQYSQLTTQNDSNRNSNRNKLSALMQLSQLLPSVSSISDPNAGANAAAVQSGGEPTNVYSPLLSIIDYIQSLQTPKFATKRKSTLEPEDFMPEGPEKPQTPCMSTEEYISPTYARNYQGVWKYVVQIPNEGYFTQTVQQTTCIKTKCDLIEGACRESPRWVSLLVAEIFYPNVYFPVNQIMPLLYKQQMQQAQQAAQQQQQQAQSGGHYQVINSNHNQNKRGGQPVVVNSQHTKFDLNALANMLKRADQQHPALQNRELLARHARTASEKGSPTEATEDGKEKHCDGYDKIGCYIVRVYYDWFLVNGSCKCWKSPNSGLNINETIKRIFIGKWKKK